MAHFFRIVSLFLVLWSGPAISAVPFNYFARVNVPEAEYTNAAPTIASTCAGLPTVAPITGRFGMRNFTQGAGNWCDCELFSADGGFTTSGNSCAAVYYGHCPANSILVNGECVCSNSFKETNGQCVSANDDDDKKCGDRFKYAGWHLGGPYTEIQHLGGKIENGVEFCVPFDPIGPKKGCKVSFSMNGQYQNDDKSWSTYGTFSPVEKSSGAGVSGESCTATDGDNPKDGEGKKPKEPECKDGYKGEVNGVSTCIPNVKNNGVNFAPDKKTEESQPDGTKKETEKKTTCEGGKCTTTTTTTTTDKNGASVTQTSKTEESEKAFCVANPSKCSNGKADAGKGEGKDKGEGDEDEGEKSKFGGGCSGGFTCEGDAIQCAIAQEQHKRSCELFVNESDESRLYKSEVAKGRNRDVTAGLIGNSTVDVAGKLSRDDLLGGARCISDLNVTIWDTNVSLPLSNICPGLEYMGWVLVAVSTLVAFRIVSGSSKES